MNRYIVPLIVAISMLGYVWFAQTQISSLKTQLQAEERQSESLRKKVEAERKVNQFVYELQAKKKIEQLERKDLSYDEFKSTYDSWVVRFNGV